MQMDALGMESSIITTSQITYSSGGISSPGPRLNTNGYWTADLHDSNQWLQISLFRQTNITGAVLMGHPSSNFYVSRYRVEVCLDGVSWENVTDENDVAEVFSQLTISSLIMYIFTKTKNQKVLVVCTNAISLMEISIGNV